MQTVYGRIRKINLHERVFEMLIKNRVEFFYFSRSQLKKFRSYLYEGLYVHFRCKDNKIKKDGLMVREVLSFTRLTRNTPRNLIVYFDLDEIKVGVSKLLSRDTYRMFIDFEFTMPSYNYEHGSGFTPEIIQYGIYLEDAENNLVLTEHQNVLPRDVNKISNRTYAFLKLSSKDFNKAQTYSEFYHTLKDIITLYQPVVYVWGKNDIFVLNNSCELHKKPKLIDRSQIINIMQVIKNYYSIKSDIGLFNAYELFGKKAPMAQDHDSLNDAVTTSEIFHLFLEKINKK